MADSYQLRKLRSKIAEMDEAYTRDIKSGVLDHTKYQYYCGKIAALIDVVAAMEEIERENE